MTGWQGSDGGSGWNQPPDPYGSGSFGPDPYGQGGYGTDPYQSGPYGTDPYGQDPYAQYPQQHPTGGFPAPGFGPPPPPKRSKLPMILSLIAIVIIVGAVVTIVLINRNKNEPVAGTSGTTSSSEPAPDSEPTSPSESSTSPSESTAPSGQDGWIPIDNPDAGLSYEVPPDWAPTTDTRPTGFEGIGFSGAAEYGDYSCEGGSYVRTFVASGSVQGKDSTDIDVGQALTDFANSFATTYYGDTATAEVPEPTETDLGGTPAMALTATVTVDVTKPACEATTGEVAMVGVPLESEGQPTGVAMLVVVSDLEGGPANPAPTTSELAQEVLDTARTS